jgi:hypothetical protein
MLPSLNEPSSGTRGPRKKSQTDAPPSIRVVETENASGFVATLVTKADRNLKLKADGGCIAQDVCSASSREIKT